MRKIVMSVMIPVLMGFVVGMVACGEAPLATVTADFYECPPNSTLQVCTVGTAPPAALMCEAVGDGETTITPQDCSLL